MSECLSTAANACFTIYQGRTFKQRFKIVDQADPPAAIDLTGKTIVGGIRKVFGGAFILNYTVTILDQTNPATKGCFELLLTDVQTETLPAGPTTSIDDRVTHYPSDLYIGEGSGEKIPFMIIDVSLVAKVAP